MYKKERTSLNFGHKIVSVFLLSLFIYGQIFAQTVAPAKSVLSAEELALADKIKIETIKEATTTLSSAEMEGRGTMQPGGDKAANWIADRFKQLGLKPLGDKDSYHQKVEFKETVATPETSLTIGDEKLDFWSDYGFLPMNNGNKDVSGDMVFVAYGIQAPSIKRDDLKGIDVRGKIVVLLS